MKDPIHLVKPKSRDRKQIVTDEDDDWFLYIETIVKKTGEKKESLMITRKDLDDWLRYLGTLGWKKGES